MFVPADFRRRHPDAARLLSLPSRVAGSPPSAVLDTVCWFSVLWVAAGLLGLGFFSGGTTSLVLAVVLLYGTGACLAVVGWLAFRALRLRAARRAAEEPDATAARDFLAAEEFARAEIRAALFPEGATGRPARADTPQAPAGPRCAARPSAKSPISKKARRKSSPGKPNKSFPLNTAVTSAAVQDDFAQAA
ncbi:hypothetical protein [Arthrobacter sp. 7Tela_A1]|uniref:hypothetical protein n=1 Tax=Arthrobacter sp. 7Tela_A1 TaxID=3093745 RepID=UPI003BB5D049